MRTEGKLKSWNDERGFGFIATANGGRDIFVHISALPQGGRRPRLGERLSFGIESAADGKQRAVEVVYLDPPAADASIAATRPARQRASRIDGAQHRYRPHRSRASRGGVFGWPLALLLTISGGVWLYGHMKDDTPNAVIAAQTPIAQQAAQPSIPEAIHCDGRQHCSQMRSCEEAEQFLRHCPDMKMDGDNDGIPCEDGLCAR